MTRLKSSLITAAVILTAATAVVAGCGSSDPEPRPNDAGYPLDEVKLNTNGVAEIPELTAKQRAEIVAVAKNDPQIKALLDGQDATWRFRGTWTRPNQELLGGIVEVKTPEPIELTNREIPTIENIEELYGKTGAEGVILEEAEPRVEPKIGTRKSPSEPVRFLSLLVDLEQRRVAEVPEMR